MHELFPSLHSMYQQFVAVVENKDHELQHSSGLIDAKNKPSTRIPHHPAGANSAHARKRHTDPHHQDGPSHSAYGQTDGYQAAA